MASSENSKRRSFHCSCSTFSNQNTETIMSIINRHHPLPQTTTSFREISTNEMRIL